MMQLDAVPAATGEWECMECGYIEEGVPARRPQECPDCGAPAQALEFFSFEDDEDARGDSTGDDDDEVLTEDFGDEDVY